MGILRYQARGCMAGIRGRGRSREGSNERRPRSLVDVCLLGASAGRKWLSLKLPMTAQSSHRLTKVCPAGPTQSIPKRIVLCSSGLWPALVASLDATGASYCWSARLWQGWLELGAPAGPAGDALSQLCLPLPFHRTQTVAHQIPEHSGTRARYSRGLRAGLRDYARSPLSNRAGVRTTGYRHPPPSGDNLCSKLAGAGDCSRVEHVARPGAPRRTRSRSTAKSQAARLAPRSPEEHASAVK